MEPWWFLWEDGGLLCFCDLDGWVVDHHVPRIINHGRATDEDTAVSKTPDVDCRSGVCEWTWHASTCGDISTTDEPDAITALILGNYDQ